MSILDDSAPMIYIQHQLYTSHAADRVWPPVTVMVLLTAIVIFSQLQQAGLWSLDS